MKPFTSFIKESFGKSVPLISVDIQPEYATYAKRVINNPKFRELIENQRDIFWYYNGMDFSSDTEDSIIEWLLYDLEFDESILDKIEFREKEYGFLRGWMDYGVSVDTIIKTVRVMVNKRIGNSSDLNLEEFLSSDEMYNLPKNDEIYLPSFSIKELKTLSGAYLIGGGEEECLKEMTILMNAFNIKYKEIKELIY